MTGRTIRALVFRLLVVGAFMLFLNYPARAEDIVFPAGTAIVDVTKSPYNADKTGATDVTSKLRDATEFAKMNDRIVYKYGWRSKPKESSASRVVVIWDHCTVGATRAHVTPPLLKAL